MTGVVLGAKAGVAVLLLVAGGSKLADVPGFAAAISAFLPIGLRFRAAAAVRDGAAAIVAAELLAGGASLCWPRLGSINIAVLVLACGFAVVATLGYARHRGQQCHCFGGLTRRRFGARGLLQALLITAVAALAARPVPLAQLQLGLPAHLLLLAGGVGVVLASYTAAGALTGGPDPEMAA